MKSSVFVRHILSMFLVGSIALGVGNMAVAADKNDPQSNGPGQKSIPVAKDNHDGLWEDNLRSDGVQPMEAQVLWGNSCSTPVRKCLIFNGPLPVGTPCWCPSIYGLVGGRVVWP